MSKLVTLTIDDKQVTVPEGTTSGAVLADALSRLGTGTTLEGVEVAPASLESAFLAITGHHLAADATAAEEATDVVHA